MALSHAVSLYSFSARLLILINFQQAGRQFKKKKLGKTGNDHRAEGEYITV